VQMVTRTSLAKKAMTIFVWCVPKGIVSGYNGKARRQRSCAHHQEAAAQVRWLTLSKAYFSGSAAALACAHSDRDAINPIQTAQHTHSAPATCVTSREQAARTATMSP
jgi:hypothetical protein